MKNIFPLSFMVLFLTLFSSNTNAQFDEKFDDNNLTVNPTWQGNLDHFTFTEDQRLQLNAPSAGSSELYTNSSFESDYTWYAKINMNFSPSKSNRLEYFFMMDEWNESTWNGYSFEIGDDGTNDGITIYRWDNGNKTEIAKGAEGKVATSPVNLNIKIERLNNAWTIYTNYTNTTFLTEEFKFTDNTYFFENGFTGFRCHYTSTRKDKFFFDDLINEKYTPDMEAPYVSELTTIDNKTILLYFNEIIDINSIENAQISVVPSNTILSKKPVGSPANAIEINFENELISGPTYTLTIAQVKDLIGNIMEPQALDFFISVSPQPEDIFISEVLFDPVSGGSDFIEIYNASNKIINLENARIENTEKNAYTYIENSMILQPNQYLALSSDIKHLKSQYETPDSANLVTQKIPSLNISSGNVTLYNPSGIMIDSFNYLKEWHYKLLESTKGVSLERISFNTSSTIQSNWFSGSTNTNYATPGYKNSNSQEVSTPTKDDILHFDKPYFSPNQDGDDDLLVIRVNSEFKGTIGSIKIFNIHGVMVKDLVNNELISNQDQFVWNGLDNQGNTCKIGHYIIYFQGFNAVGKKVSIKKAIKLLDFI